MLNNCVTVEIMLPENRSRRGGIWRGESHSDSSGEGGQVLGGCTMLHLVLIERKGGGTHCTPKILVERYEDVTLRHEDSQ